VRAIKNRFGAANELGVFAMTERGLKGVTNPSALFLSQHGQAVAGSAIVATLEGSRPLLVEIQALVDPVQGGMPRRLAVGLDPQRLALLLAVLHRHGGVETAGYDVFVNAVGGVRILEPAADLAVLLAINSSLKNSPLPAKSIVFGEVGLAGEIRPFSAVRSASARPPSSASPPFWSRRRISPSRASTAPASSPSSASRKR
jgi:DNA repair protein RadA/Sms